MIRYVIVSVAGGLLFGAMDGLINANPLAQKLYGVFKPVARTAINVPAGIVIDLVYGFALAGIFLMLFKSLPGDSGLLKGVSFAVLAWFFRVVMGAVSQWMMFNVPVTAGLYTIAAGLVEMLVLGILFGLFLKV